MAKRLKKPREPAPGECCGSGCTRCVWDVYYDALAAYEAARAQGTAADDEEESSTRGSDDMSEPSSSITSSDEEAGVTDYIGAVVVKMLEAAPPPLSHEDKDVHAVSVLQDFVPVTHIEHIHCSTPTHSPPEAEKRHDAIHILRLRLAPGTEDVHALPGDVVEVFVPNIPYGCDAEKGDVVTMLCARLQLQPSHVCELRRSPFVPEDHFPPWLPERQPMTLRHLLTYYVDLSSSSYVLRPVFFQSLLRVYEMQQRQEQQQQRGAQVRSAEAAESNGDECGEDKAARVALLRRCAEPSAAPALFRSLSKNYANEAQGTSSCSSWCYPSLMDVLDAFDFVQLPLARLLELAGPVRARKFSVVRTRLTSVPDSERTAAEGGEGVVPEVELCVREVCHRQPDLPENHHIGTHGSSSSCAAAAVLAEQEDTTAVELVRLLNRARRARRGSCIVNAFHGHVTYPLCNWPTIQNHSTLWPPIYLSTRLFHGSAFARALHEAVHALVTRTAMTSVKGGAASAPALLLLGAGTGIAPLMAAVYALHAARTAQSSQEHTMVQPTAHVSPYACWVWYGARTHAELVYDDALRAAADGGAIHSYETAVSREVHTNNTSDVVVRHVTDLLRSHRPAIRDMFANNIGRLFACGPASMLREVRHVLASEVLAEADDDASVQEQRVRLLEAKERLCFDVWSTVSPFE